ncbi:hypothetical protein PR202_ga24839 [Eleusine coracana subsp. coracana]|uniref:EF-hand domain-containing protein n=1 Tax=Eleusine coracana subsp. coracana TaxID=191504 RepID=A0AAV5D7S6_ELECO|nr:hypothetical protein PR202_ga24839 [Eleusine coracana subsp. coracana]
MAYSQWHGEPRGAGQCLDASPLREQVRRDERARRRGQVALCFRASSLQKLWSVGISFPDHGTCEPQNPYRTVEIESREVHISNYTRRGVYLFRYKEQSGGSGPDSSLWTSHLRRQQRFAGDAAALRLSAIFERFDRDRSGKIDAFELRDALLSLGYSVSPTVLDLLVSKFDKTGASAEQSNVASLQVTD